MILLRFWMSWGADVLILPHPSIESAVVLFIDEILALVFMLELVLFWGADEFNGPNAAPGGSYVLSPGVDTSELVLSLSVIAVKALLSLWFPLRCPENRSVICRDGNSTAETSVEITTRIVNHADFIFLGIDSTTNQASKLILKDAIS